MQTQRIGRVKRLPAIEHDERGALLPRHLHINGYVIQRQRRSWSTRGYTRGASGEAALLYTWTVHRHAGTADAIGTRYQAGACFSARAASNDFESFAEACAWCDVHPRTGWGAQT